ncbi:hypothetical protein DSCO28_46460 [Desulfosarcina ovata subsp. sediminis]|uniref:Enoyl-CoA hydratase n=1 Tax=Desulfosarcina ovata subsp. sediminis TaxID=885957 RepID=A0A5K7ZV54_9BACT|nr:enoyl-CoA hydratase-related protein [Desulfosarcina ovata]BBO84080.1 hypothetical protein DSCO28_46460 [Desulfosarcina ovata subsp. sediminis]
MMKPEINDHVAVIRIDHPPANAWDLTTMTAFGKAIAQVESDPCVRVLIITGAGDKFFSAGFDVSDAENTAAISNLGRDVWRRLDRFPKPVIAAINGYALGGGLELAMACHFRLLADAPRLKMGLTELNLGIIPGWGGTQRLPRLVGRAKALEMILFSQTLDAREAFDCGLVDRLVPPEQLLDEAMVMAKRLAERPPVAVRCVLDAFSAGTYEGLDQGLMTEAEGAGTVRQTEDREEGFAAFKEKRKPRFVGR